MINPQWFELPMSRTNFHGPNDVRAIEVGLYMTKDLHLTVEDMETEVSRYSFMPHSSSSYPKKVTDRKMTSTDESASRLFRMLTQIAALPCLLFSIFGE